VLYLGLATAALLRMSRSKAQRLESGLLHVDFVRENIVTVQHLSE